MKVRASVKKICDKCKVTIRRGWSSRATSRSEGSLCGCFGGVE